MEQSVKLKTPESVNLKPTKYTNSFIYYIHTESVYVPFDAAFGSELCTLKYTYAQ